MNVIQYAIVTYARSWSALAAVRSLGDRGVRCIVADSVAFGAATFSKYAESSFVYPDPADEREFIKCLVNKCVDIHKKTGGNILLCPIHEEVYVISRHRDRFPAYVHFVLPEDDMLQRIQHKGDLIALAKKYDVRIPPSWYGDVKDAHTLPGGLSFPVFIKLPESSGSTGIYRADDEQAYADIIKNLSGKVVIQSFVEGIDYCCCCLLQEGRAVVIINYKALRTYPFRGGTSVYRKTIHNPDIDRMAKRLLMNVGWNGVAELDFRIGPDGKVYLIEVNPRFWGGLNHAVKANADFPYLVWRMAEGITLQPIENIDRKVRTRNFVGALASTIEEMTSIHKPGPAWKDFLKRPRWKTGKLAITSLFKTIPLFRKYIVRRYLKQKSFDDIYDPKDPGALAGLAFPLAVYAKYGKINEKLLVSTSAKKVLD